MSKQVSETAKALREAENGLVQAIVDAKSYAPGWIVAILADNGTALLTHHKAVEAEQERQRVALEDKEFGGRIA